jgi:hypothetical protein
VPASTISQSKSTVQATDTPISVDTVFGLQHAAYRNRPAFCRPHSFHDYDWQQQKKHSRQRNENHRDASICEQWNWTEGKG